MGSLTALVAWTALVVSPAETLGDVAPLYDAMDPVRWAGLAGVGLVWGGVGVVAALSIVVPGFPVALGFFTQAEALGTAPPTGDVSRQQLVLSAAGAGLVGASAVLLVVELVVRAAASRRRGLA